MSFSFEHLRWYHLVAIWMLGCALLIALPSIFVARSNVMVGFGLPRSFFAALSTIRFLWSQSPSFAILLLGLPTFTIGMLVWGIVRAFGHR